MIPAMTADAEMPDLDDLLGNFCGRRRVAAPIFDALAITTIGQRPSNALAEVIERSPGLASSHNREADSEIVRA